MAEGTTGTYTFLFTDIEGSTALQRAAGNRFADHLADHHRIMREAFAAHAGEEVVSEGDSFFVMFANPSAAVAAALGAQRGLGAHDWGDHPVRVRMGIHTGEATLTPAAWVGLAINQAARISAAGHGGQILLSDVVATVVEASLPDGAGLRDLGEHRLKDVPLPQRLLQLTHNELAVELPPLRTAAPATWNLPQPVTSFVGRAGALEEVAQLLDDHRLVTLTAAGGAGKTRLAIEVARRVASKFVDGVWMVELASLTSNGDDDVAEALASTLEVTPRDESLGDAITRTLAGKTVLIVVDNCEHVVGAAAKVVERLLLAIPGVTVLATSREPLGATGERVWHVAPLTTAGDGELSASAQLFIDRAATAGGSVDAAADGAAIERLCARLDGLPLAIELAAACVRMLSVSELEARLDDRFRVLSRGARNAPARQQTLRATVDWSYDLLGAPERSLLRRLAVFSGGFDLDAVEAICAGNDLEVFDVFEMLGRLVDTSLVRRVAEAGHARFAMLETVRSYAAEKLLDAEGRDVYARRHAEYFARLAADAHEGIRTPDAATWLGRLDRDDENVRTALGYLVEAAQGTEALALVGHLATWWRVRGRAADAGRWARAALDSAPHAAPRERGDALLALGWATRATGDAATARALLDETLATARTSGDASLLVRAAVAALAQNFPAFDDALLSEAEEAAGTDLALLSDVRSVGIAALFVDGDLEGAQGAAVEAVAYARQSNEPLVLLRAIQSSAMLGPSSMYAVGGDAQVAELGALAEQLGDVGTLLRMLELQATGAERAGDLDLAVTRTEEARALASARSPHDAGRLEKGLRRRVAQRDRGHEGLVEFLEAEVRSMPEDADAREGFALLNELGAAYADAHRFEDSIRTYEKVAEFAQGAPLLVAGVFGMISDMALLLDDVNRAERFYERQQVIAAATGGQLAALVEGGAAELFRAKGDLTALHRARLQRQANSEQGHPLADSEMDRLVGLAGDLDMLGEHDLAATLLGAAEAARTEGEFGGTTSEAAHRKLREAIAERLGAEQLDTLEAEGRGFDAAARGELFGRAMEILRLAAEAQSA